MNKYHRAGSVPYTRKDGTHTRLDVWASACAVCGARFTISVPVGSVDSKAFGRKHCDQHKLTKGEIKTRWVKGIRDAREVREILGG
jgi:hypothetical protein